MLVPDTHCTCCPRQCRRHSHQLRHTPSDWGCSGGSHIQTGRLYRTYLEEGEIRYQCQFQHTVSTMVELKLTFSKCLNWPQWASSAPFSQSFSLSQVQLIGIQRPLGQAKNGAGHLVFPLPDGQTDDKRLKLRGRMENIPVRHSGFRDKKKNTSCFLSRKYNWKTY